MFNMSIVHALGVLLLSYPAQTVLVEWCVLPSTVHVLQNQSCSSFVDLAALDVDIAAMKGETENRQIIVKLNNVSGNAYSEIYFKPLVHQTLPSFVISNTSWQYWQVCYVNCKETIRYEGSGGGWRPDPLLDPPEDGVALMEGMSQPLWIGLNVPRNVPAGLYTGQIEIVVSVNEESPTLITIPVFVGVWNITVPTIRNANFSSIFSFTYENLAQFYNGTLTDEMKRDYFSFVDQQRLPGDLLYMGEPRILEDYQILEAEGAQWMNLLDVSDAARVDSVGQGNVKDCSNYSESQISHMLNVLTPAVDLVERLGLLNRSYVYGFDEAEVSCENGIRQLFGAVKSKWPSLRTVAVLDWPEVPTDLPLDVWVIQYQMYNASASQSWLKSGKEVWWYHCISPSEEKYLNTFIERPLLETRLLFWLAAANFDISGWLYYAIDLWIGWPKPKTIITRINNTAMTDWDPANYVWLPNHNIFANGDGYFLYPGPKGPLPSVRLHNIRDGFEDVELFRMIPEEKARNLTEALVRGPTDFTLDPEVVERTRRTAAAIITSLLEEGPI